MRPNAMKARFARGEAAYGCNVMFPSVQIVETIGRLGFDWVLLDCEHGAITVESLDALTAAADAVGITPIVRPSSNDPVSIGQVLDRGAHGIQVPHVDTVEDARRAVAAAKYYPLGERGIASGTRASDYGVGFRATEFAARTNEETLVCIQFEHRNALDNLEEILKVEGVDVFFLGPMDMSLSLGHPGKFDEPVVREAYERVFDAIRKAGKIAGTSGNAGFLRRFRDYGILYNYTSLVGLMVEGAAKFRADMEAD